VILKNERIEVVFICSIRLSNMLAALARLRDGRAQRAHTKQFNEGSIFLYIDYKYYYLKL
jgi:hypothetical protein